MTADDDAPARVQTWYIHLSDDECRARLADAAMGRLGVVVGGRPEIFPVNHVFDPATGTVLFPSKVGTKLAAALEWPSVAFEVDGMADDGGTGWSVLLVGRAEEVADADRIATAAASRTARWAAGAGTRWVRIVPSSITGRRISAVDL